MRPGSPREINTCPAYITINNGSPASGTETAFKIIRFPDMVIIVLLKNILVSANCNDEFCMREWEKLWSRLQDDAVENTQNTTGRAVCTRCNL